MEEEIKKFKIPNDVYFIDKRPPHIVFCEQSLKNLINEGFDATPFVKVNVTLTED